ncbi:MAG: bifunctional histidinol-phosphatase/imidazoleglycerol-phosphate dehydratase [Alphaproteobacteria bacterium]
MTARLDLSRSPDDHAAEARAELLGRAAALLNLAVDQLVLASSPADARRACTAAGVTLAADRAADGPLAVARPSAAAPCLYRLGPVDAPLVVIVAGDSAAAGRIRDHLSPPAACLVSAAGDALSPGALLAAEAAAHERRRALQPVYALLAAEPAVSACTIAADGLLLTGRDGDTLARRLTAMGLVMARHGDTFAAAVATAAEARRLARHMGLSAAGRSAHVRRTTAETDVTVVVDLERSGGTITTGVAFYDHMLAQIARHGGFALDVSCVGDVAVDVHHSVEDVALALGEALRQALGDKRGLGRFGFELPMDETRAGVWIDLSGRPYCRFAGEIPGERVSDFPVEMTGHVFRSLADSLQAAIHVQVSGDNAHHMIESCFKALGRALRQALHVAGDTLPSTKGVL